MMPPKLTKFLAAVAAVLAWAFHDPSLAPVWGVHPRLFGLASSLLVLFAALGISGPTLAPRIAAALGNPGAKAADAPPPPPPAT
jgi:hypothetical protein